MTKPLNETPLEWDNGKAFFDMLNEDLVRWDGRDCFYIDTTSKLVERLSKLDPTNFVAQSYVSALMSSCMGAVKFDLGRILYNEEVQQWIENFKSLKESTQASYLPHLNNFLESLKSKVSHMEIDINLDHIDMAKLLRDALCATDIRLDWIYAYEGDPVSINTFSTKLYRYPSIKDLEMDIINKVLPYGCHMIGVDTIQGDKATVSNIIVCNTPNRAFMLSNLYFAFSQNEMISQDTKENSYNRLSEPSTHFPKWDNIDQLPIPFGENKYQYSDISCLEPKQALWSLMTMELASIMVSQVQPKSLSASVSLLEHKDKPDSNLPAIWTKPFDIDHKSIEDLIEEFKLNTSPNKDWLIGLLDGLTTEDLLPDLPMIGFDVIERKAMIEFKTDSSINPNSLNRYGNTPSTAGHGKVNLYPKPSNAYGTTEQITESINKILSENFNIVLSQLKSVDWESHIEKTEKWFERALRRKFESVVDCFELNKNYINFKPKYYQAIFNPQVPMSSPYMRYKICHEVNYDNNPLRLLSVTAPRIGEWSNKEMKYKGFITGNLECESFFVFPMDWQDICILLDCKRSALPKPLRNWHRTNSTPWAGRGITKPLCALVFV